jgi:TPR repeat protein
MQNWLRAAVMVVALGCAGPVMAGVWEDMAAADARGDHATLIRLIRPFAEQGNGAAQANLGSMYHNGQGVPKDDAQAVKWYRLAAEQGNGATREAGPAGAERLEGPPGGPREAVMSMRYRHNG